MNYFLGIDPGKTGAYAILDGKGAVLLCTSFESWAQVYLDIKPYRKEIVSCAIEKVSSKSGQGVKSVFTFGMNFGGWLSFLEVLRIPHELVPPARWQKTFLGSFPAGESKARSLDFIKRKYPHVTLSRKKDHGLSDAICLGLFSILLYRRTVGMHARHA